MSIMNELNKDIKVFYIDLDGTSLDTKKDNILWLSDENLAAIKKVRSEGKEVIISTGRLGKAVARYVELIDSKYSVTGNGAQIIDRHGKVLREFKLSIRQVLLILDFAQKNKMVMKIDDNTIAHGTSNFFQGWLSQKFHFQPVPHYNFELHKERVKIVLWGKSKSKLKKLQVELLKYVDGICVVSSSNGWTLEVTHEEATKGKANEYVSKHLLNVPIEQTAHLGDTMNDSTVIGHVGRFIVMGNAQKDLKKMSIYQGPNFKNGGMAKVLNGEYKVINQNIISGDTSLSESKKESSIDEDAKLFGEAAIPDEKVENVAPSIEELILVTDEIELSEEQDASIEIKDINDIKKSEE